MPLLYVCIQRALTNAVSTRDPRDLLVGQCRAVAAAVDSTSTQHCRFVVFETASQLFRQTMAHA